MQDKTGGYCPMCDTVWALPGKCRCEEAPILPKIQSTDELIKETCNAAIEAAAGVAEINSAAEIRKLKK